MLDLANGMRQMAYSLANSEDAVVREPNQQKDETTKVRIIIWTLEVMMTRSPYELIGSPKPHWMY